MSLFHFTDWPWVLLTNILYKLITQETKSEISSYFIFFADFFMDGLGHYLIGKTFFNYGKTSFKFLCVIISGEYVE